jgi:hypothetical protein
MEASPRSPNGSRRDARPLRLGLLNARKTHALHRFAEVFLPAYHAAKTARDGSISTT